MSKQPGEPGIGKARLLAVRDLIAGGLADLTTDLQSDVLTSDFVMPPFGAILPAQVRIGDLNGLWDSKTGAFRFRIMAGMGQEQATDASIQLKYIGGQDKEQTFYTALAIYIHPDCWRTQDLDLQEEQREILRAILLDWARCLLNRVDNDRSVDNRVLHLTSHEYEPAPGFDALYFCHVSMTTLGYTLRSFGKGDVVYGVNLMHQGKISG